MRTLLFFSNALLHPPGTWTQVLTCNFIVDAYKLDLVITFKSFKEFLLSLSKLRRRRYCFSLLQYLSLL